MEVTRWTRKSPGKISTIFEQLQEAGYRASEKKSEFFLKETRWLGHEKTKRETKPNKEKLKAILQIKSPISTKELKLFLEAVQYNAKLLPKLSEKTNRISQLLQKKSEWNGIEKKRTLTLQSNR